MMVLKPVVDNGVKPFSDSKENCCITLQDKIPYKESYTAYYGQFDSSNQTTFSQFVIHRSLLCHQLTITVYLLHLRGHTLQNHM